MSKSIGTSIKIGDINYIKKFRLRQKNPIDDFKIELAPGKRSLKELETELIAVWHNQLKYCYGLPIMDDAKSIATMAMFRKFIQENGKNKLKGLYRYLKNRKVFDDIGICLSEMSDEEKILYFVPFLTTLDTFMISLSYKTFGEDLSDFFDRVPVRFVGMLEDDDMVVCRLVNNGQNNPGNSVFGPTGVICPGSNVTTQILKAIRDFCNNNSWEVEGTPIQEGTSSIASIKNLEDVFITIK